MHISGYMEKDVGLGTAHEEAGSDEPEDPGEGNMTGQNHQLAVVEVIKGHILIKNDTRENAIQTPIITIIIDGQESVPRA
jgi:hypothetical protein